MRRLALLILTSWRPLLKLNLSVLGLLPKQRKISHELAAKYQLAHFRLFFWIGSSSNWVAEKIELILGSSSFQGVVYHQIEWLAFRNYKPKPDIWMLKILPPLNFLKNFWFILYSDFNRRIWKLNITEMISIDFLKELSKLTTEIFHYSGCINRESPQLTE
jgi:hypothetical protein